MDHEPSRAGAGPTPLAAEPGAPRSPALERARFLERLEDEYARAERYDRPLSMAFLAIDDLARIEDAYGEGIRQCVLEAVQRVCRVTLRRHDVVAERDSGELVLLLVETGLEGAVVAAERVRAAVGAQPIVHRGTAFWVTVSLGVVSLPHALVSRAADLLALASAALYDAQHSGCDHVVIAR